MPLAATFYRLGQASLFVLTALVSAGCGTSAPVKAPGTPPTPASVTHDHPGGDAADPEEAALHRQLTAGWGFAEDKDGQLRIPLIDAKNWERVRYWALDHFVGFKYGDDFHALNAVFLLDVKDATELTSTACLRKAEKWSHPQLESYQVKLQGAHVDQTSWHDETVWVESMDGYVDFGLERHEFSAAYAAYPAYPDACLVFGIAVPWRKHPELAKQVRDRWVKEGVRGIAPLTKTRPYRK
jgi:hypothetical protein